jgi:trans-AT polyketide synthase/acyltransferase/oxidoreductase domain-containing protein
MIEISPQALGAASFRADYGLRYAYLCGAMYKGISSKEMVVAAGRAGLLAYLGTGGMRLHALDESIQYIQRELGGHYPYGMNLLSNLDRQDLEMQTVQLFLRRGVMKVEAAAYMEISLALVAFRLAGLRRAQSGRIEASNRILAKVSRPEVAEAFMRPAPEALVRQLCEQGLLTPEQAELGRHLPMAQDICVEADSGGHTDRGNPYVLMPSIQGLRDRVMAEQRYAMPIRIGAAGGIGSPQAALAAFMLGADFIMTGSINQCTVEAGTSESVKDMLQGMNVQDTAYAPAGDMFEVGAKVQVLKKGVLFPSRASKLYELYNRFDSLDEIDGRTRSQIEEKYFRRSFEEVWKETREYYTHANPAKLVAAERNPKQKMALIFRWYFVHTTRLAMRGTADHRVDYQIHAGPAMGVFNQWVRGTPLEDWRNRRVAHLAELLMAETAKLLNYRIGVLASGSSQSGSTA